MTTPFVAIEDLAKHLAVSVSTVRGWVRQGHIPENTFLKINNVYRFDKQAVSDALLKKTSPEPVRYTSHDNTQYEMDLNLDEVI
jgi:excisionase family DNA binding protein